MALLACASSALAADPAPSIPAIAAMQRRFDALTDLSASFERTFQWKLTDRRQTFKGKLTLKKPDRFRFEADGQVVSADGKSVWNYTPANRQVVVNRHVSPEKDRSPEGLLFHLLFRGTYARDYAARDAGAVKMDGKACRLIDLTACKEGAYIAAVRLYVETRSALPVRVEYTDINGDLTTYRLWGFRPDRKVPDDAFRFTPPPGVEVVDLR
ncbi:outer membrane lipoprotein carrier protein LolA [bacterium]|nr:outer membrane lipoprotein carrier protein LolA [bacterium]